MALKDWEDNTNTKQFWKWVKEDPAFKNDSLAMAALQRLDLAAVDTAKKDEMENILYELEINEFDMDMDDILEIIQVGLGYLDLDNPSAEKIKDFFEVEEIALRVPSIETDSDRIKSVVWVVLKRAIDAYGSGPEFFNALKENE